MAGIAIIVLLAAFGSIIKLTYFGTTPSSDYHSYRETAKLFSGDPGAAVFPHRILKPLNPLLVAFLGLFMGIPEAFVFQSVFFYLAFAVILFFLARKFFGRELPAVFVALFGVLSYPMLRYGVDLFTETGALFFYTLSLLLSLSFLKQPSQKIFFWNVAAIILGFLWKEYSIVAAVIFGLVLIFHPDLVKTEKVRLVAWFAGVFLFVNIFWQIFIFLKYHYTYLSWYYDGGVGGFAHEYTLYNLTKSTAAVLGLAWLFVPLAVNVAQKLPAWKKRFLYIAVPAPFLVLAWGAVSSRLFYVMAPAFLLLSVLGIERLFPRKNHRIMAAGAVVAVNIAWLFILMPMIV